MYNWRKALANAGFIFVGVIIAKTTTEHFPDLAQWRTIVLTAAQVTFLAELRYVYKFLSTYGSENGGQSQKI